MRYHVSHTTRYGYCETVSICYNQARLTPRNCLHQVCHASRLDIRPAAVIGQRRRDYFGNEVTYFTVQEPHRALSIAVESEIELLALPPAAPDASPPWDRVAGMLQTERTSDVLDAYQFRFASAFVRPNAELREYARESFAPERPILESAIELTGRIFRDFTYDPTATTVATPLEEVLRKRRGVCQDFAHLQVACLRSMGLAARYVSGYILSGTNDGEQHLTGSQASHAWVSVFVPGTGWFDVDPTNNMTRSMEHISLAWGRDYEDVSPVRGVVLGGGEHTLAVDVNVVPLESA